MKSYWLLHGQQAISGRKDPLFRQLAVACMRDLSLESYTTRRGIVLCPPMDKKKSNYGESLPGFWDGSTEGGVSTVRKPGQSFLNREKLQGPS